MPNPDTTPDIMSFMGTREEADARFLTAADRWIELRQPLMANAAAHLRSAMCWSMKRGSNWRTLRSTWRGLCGEKGTPMFNTVPTRHPKQQSALCSRKEQPTMPAPDTTTYTLGPWHAKYGEIVSASGEILGVVYRTQAWSTGDRIEYEDQANAALLTAAPDLLAALKGVLRVADRATAEFDAARAAIAKAEEGQ